MKGGRHINIFTSRLFILVILVPYLFIGSQTTEASETFTKRLDDFLKQEQNLEGSLVSISIRNPSTGKIIYDYNGDLRLRPASNLKLFTAAAALETLGEDYRFSTELLSDGRKAWKVLHGNLYIRGKGDPTLLPSDIDKMVLDLKKQGIEMVIGDIIADDSWYDDVRYSIDIPWSDETTYYGAQISGLTVSPTNHYDAGTVLFTVKPGKDVNDKARISVYPKTEYISIINETKTVATEEHNELSIKREHGSNLIKVTGDIPLQSKIKSKKIAVWEPTGLALDVFKQMFKKHEIKHIGATFIGTTPESATVITLNQSMPLSKIVLPFLKLSNNVHGDTFVKEMGKVKKGEGSWSKGLSVLDEKIEGLGINPNELVIRDGSGISHVNLIRANDLTKLLYVIQEKDWFESFYHALPVAGHDDKLIGGTLRHRLKGSQTKRKVVAKTGTISTVSSISGYIENSSGDTYIFAIILNNLTNDVNGKRIEDDLITIIANG
ncbi:D-alanyl-D-alanine carboxypeptidase/D-alanyl-D-alanine-endopeptidase [Bacillus alkalicellulosilyticus]|uniref:D-alanyl-D-alanine carboxypeptidase/D-alanyl-D-alanine endopeptidase n=1 Tax=Alkalihalobacterium alkalicellulosilyticum TaxID=1912214 RepID=UPI0009962F5E|nr:D-alanyl-D-alanine carboxypeptidase/D-alanyl-D-alanine-endopeptidase [Bacillus alkalicellulosilyticus]